MATQTNTAPANGKPVPPKATSGKAPTATPLTVGPVISSNDSDAGFKALVVKSEALGRVDGAGKTAQPDMMVEVIAQGSSSGVLALNRARDLFETFRKASADRAGSKDRYKVLSDDSWKKVSSQIATFHGVGAQPYGMTALGVALTASKTYGGNVFNNLYKCAVAIKRKKKILSEAECKTEIGKKKETSQADRWIAEAEKVEKRVKTSNDLDKDNAAKLSEAAIAALVAFAKSLRAMAKAAE